MKILLVSPRGFCAGVNMAIEALDRAIALFGTPLYVYHEIVHNRPVVERFRKRGVVFVDGIDEVPQGATVLYSAHGVAPSIRQAAAARRLQAIDATCPLVTKVHLEAVRFANEGYTIILIGHEGHDEVLGTMGEVPNQIRLVQNADDVDRLDLPADCKLYGVRHKFGTDAILRKIPGGIKTLSVLMGHTTTRSTERYVHLDDQLDFLREALEHATRR